MPRFGITTTFVNPREPQQFKDAITDDTRLVFGETLGNPGIEVMDIPVIAEIAHEAGLPLMIDSTFTTPYLMNPIDHGADIIMHSLTKYMGGHGVAIGGVFIGPAASTGRRRENSQHLLNPTTAITVSILLTSLGRKL